MITIHHLGISQSERIVWLAEELGIEYKLVKHTRAPVLAPDSLKSLPGNETGKAPFIEDSTAGITLSESGAVAEYIIQKYGDGRLRLGPDHPQYADFLYWFHHSNASLQPAMLNGMFFQISGLPDDSRLLQLSADRLSGIFQHLDDRLRSNKWLAGEEFTVADIMSVYSLTTQRYWGPIGPTSDLVKYPNIVRWLNDVAGRPAYQRATEKGDPDMRILNSAEPTNVSMFQVGGVQSDHWKKDEYKL